MEELNNKKRVRDDSDESELDSPEVKRLRDDLLGTLDDSDLCTTNPDLDSFMKSFEEEISASPSPAPVVELTSDSGESRPDFGFLLEASDDELGIPPSTTASPTDGSVEWLRVWSNSGAELSELGFEDQIPSYDSFDFGIAGDGDNYNGNDDLEYSALDELFDYSDLGFGFSDAPV
ncbi:Protein like [Actinidia chinensis var. chinensis]|uniref:Protein like n=1 Tax=Actinidia chinensis var. chinensis TaxID=1590841 RepID=A0A2R6P3U2_ACTCC|nr:Protein like [Actinidia chinensis var. chinensis]